MDDSEIREREIKENLTEFKNWIRNMYQRCVDNDIRYTNDKRHKGHNTKTLRELRRNLRLLRNNHKGITNYLFNYMHKMVSTDGNYTHYCIKLTTRNPKSNYYISFWEDWWNKIAFDLKYFYKPTNPLSVCINFTENLLFFLP